MAKRDKFASLDTYLVVDPYIQTLNANDRWLFFVLICNPDISMIGIYEIGLPTLELYTGLGREALDASMARFSEQGKIHYVDGWVIIKNHIKNNPIRGDKLLVGAHKRLADVPWHIRERFARDGDPLYIPHLDPDNTQYIGYAYGIDTPGTPSPALTPALTPSPSLRGGDKYHQGGSEAKKAGDKTGDNLGETRSALARKRSM